LCRLSDHYVSINCGPEIGVAATKSFTAQLAVIYSIIDNFCTNTSSLELSTDTFSNVLNEILKDDSYLEKIAEDIKSVQDIYILGTSFHYPIALEGALKIKELAYIHAEGIAAGEIKHGPLALIEPSTIVIVLNPEDETYHNILNSINEMKSRGAKIIGISNKNNDLYDYFIKLPLVNKYLYPIIEIIPLQILSYYLAIKKNANPDYPRNLAKSVTVK
jgi:glucosamine--fructose-6-phosphate aminotransferase (isomerizing)